LTLWPLCVAFRLPSSSTDIAVTVVACVSVCSPPSGLRRKGLRLCRLALHSSRLRWPCSLRRPSCPCLPMQDTRPTSTPGPLPSPSSASCHIVGMLLCWHLASSSSALFCTCRHPFHSAPVASHVSAAVMPTSMLASRSPRACILFTEASKAAALMTEMLSSWYYRGVAPLAPFTRISW
jgi:hypothetical protein